MLFGPCGYEISGEGEEAELEEEKRGGGFGGLRRGGCGVGMVSVMARSRR